MKWIRFGDYEVSEFGEILSYKRKITKVLKHSKNKQGYHRIYLENKIWAVHRLVATLFIREPVDKEEINHIDGDKDNNHYSNLEWCDRLHNMRYAFVNKLIVRRYGEDHHSFGKKMTKEFGQNISERLKGKYVGDKNPCFRGYWITPLGKFDNLKEAAVINKCAVMTVRGRCFNERPKWDKWIFEPAERAR